METLSDQIAQVTNDFLDTIRKLTEQHAQIVLKETFSSLGGKSPHAASGGNGARARGAKRGADELEHLSARFVQFVTDNPGLRIEQINKQLGTTTAALALPIRKLIAEGKITVEGQKRSTTYFAGKGDGADAAATGEGEDTGEGKSSSRSRKKSSRSKKSRSSGKSRSKSKKK